jgi:hypothetical protein
MSSKTQAYILVALTILAALTPVVSILAGLNLPTAAHVLAALIAVAGSLKLVLSPSTSDKVRIEGAAEVPGATERLAVAIAKKDAKKGPPPLATGLLFLLVTGCAAVPALVVTIAGDVCKLVAQDDPTEPQWAQVACTIEGEAGPVIVELPWSSWISAQGQTSAQAKAFAKAKAKK